MHDRRAWCDLPLGWLLAPSLAGPHLVFPENAGEFNQQEDLKRARLRFLSARANARDPKLRYKYSVAIKQLRRAHVRLVELAVGYSYPEAWFPLPVEPAPVLWLFDPHPYEEGFP